MPNGSIVDSGSIVDHGDPSRRFDIVILGEGFRRGSLATFESKAKILANRLLAMPPFDQVAHLINVHTVSTISTESGVSDFVRPNDPRKTYYNVRARYPSPDGGTSKSYLNTDTPHLVMDAASNAAPIEDIELYIVLCNVKSFAASAPPGEIVYTGLHATDADLVNYTAHEVCHSIAKTAEEYIDGNGPRDGVTYPNQVTETQRKKGDVWWKSLALASELDGSGAFRAVHMPTTPNVHFTATRRSPRFTAQPSLNKMLGLFWGCQDIDESITLKAGLTDADLPWIDNRGENYYRPMAECRMRNVELPFCRVCSHKMLEKIRQATL